MSLPLRVFILCCGLLPLIMVAVNLKGFVAITGSLLVPGILCTAFAALGLACIHTLFRREMSSSAQAERSVA